MGLGGAVRRWHQDLALLVATSYSRPRGRVRPCCCCALLVALLFFVVVIPQMGQLTFHASSSSARSIFFIFSMGQWTSRCPAAVSLFAFLGELYVSFLAGPRLPSLRCCVRWRFARVFPFFLFLLPVAIIYSFFVFPPRCGRVWVSPVVLLRGLLFLCVSTTCVSDIAVERQYQKRGLSTIGTLYILCVSLVGTRAPFETAGIGLSCAGGGWARWQPGGA